MPRPQKIEKSKDFKGSIKKLFNKINEEDYVENSIHYRKMTLYL